MNISSFGKDPSLPGELWYQPPCVFDFPFCVEVGDQWHTTGSGIGTSSTSIKTAIGEYFERRHFYLEILPDTSSSLEKSLGSAEVEKFINAFGQTAAPDTTLINIASRKFNMSSAFRISDFSECFIPTICISLTHYGNERDNSVYPSRDTCGCSFHWNSKSAIFGSIKESMERQFLTRFWLTKQCVEVLNHDQISSAIKEMPSYRLYNALVKSGELITIDISDKNFPGACLLTIYGNNDPKRNVRYCAGMSYAENRAEALEKSIHELWQTFRFMNLFQVFGGDIDSIQDSYLRHFMKCNSYQTFEEITSHFTYVPADSGKRSPYQFDVQGMIEALRQQEIEGYLYIKSTLMNGTPYTSCKFISPSLFMHMDNSKNINLENDYSTSFLSSIYPERKEVMVPFP